MDKPADLASQGLEHGIALLLRVEEAMIDAVAEAAASARLAGHETKAAQMEDYMRQLRVDLLRRRSMVAFVGITEPHDD